MAGKAARGGSRRHARACCNRYRNASPASSPPGARANPASNPSRVVQPQRRVCKHQTYQTVSARNRLSVIGAKKNTDAGLTTSKTSASHAVRRSYWRQTSVNRPHPAAQNSGNCTTSAKTR